MNLFVNDADEMLEVYDAAGHPTGQAKRRGDIHRDGDWHLAFFCWIVRANGQILLQRRSELKDVWPGRFDASAAGHVRFGEGLTGALREIEEELGIAPPPLNQLDYLGRFRSESEHEHGIVCREHQDMFRWRCDIDLADFRPGPEVGALVVMDLDQLAALGDRMVPHDPRMLAALAAQ